MGEWGGCELGLRVEEVGVVKEGGLMGQGI